MSTYKKLLTTRLPEATKLAQQPETETVSSVNQSQVTSVTDEDIPSLDEILAMLGEPHFNDMPGS